MSKAKKLQSTLNNFVEKLSRVNKPYQALKTTDQYEAFHKSFSDAIKKQAAWASEHMGEIDRHGNDRQYLERNMPKIATLVNQQDVADYFKYCFEWGAKAQYQRWGIAKANSYSNFSLSNKKYIDRLNDNADYLLSTKSSLDDTTTDQIIKIIQAGKNATDEDGNSVPMTNEQIADQIGDDFDDISDSRADMITRTETASAMGDGNYATMEENNVPQVDWVTAGDNPCPICDENADASPINVGDTFPSGDTNEPAHPNCECYTQADTSEIDLDSISIWDGS